MTGSKRPWPTPRFPWVMRQTWLDLLFAHWPVDAARLRALVPQGLELDEYEGQAWLALTPFALVGLRLRGLPPPPGASAFPELNVRTYVRMEGRPGIYFFSLDAGSALAVAAARTLLRLPYRYAAMHLRRDGESVHYRSRRKERPEVELDARYRATGPPFEARSGSLEEWLTERYCLYTHIAGRWCRLEIDHRPWLLQTAEAHIEKNTMGHPLGLALGPPALLHFARRQDVVAWPPYPVARRGRSALSPRPA